MKNMLAILCISLLMAGCATVPPGQQVVNRSTKMEKQPEKKSDGQQIFEDIVEIGLNLLMIPMVY